MKSTTGKQEIKYHILINDTTKQSEEKQNNHHTLKPLDRNQETVKSVIFALDTDVSIRYHGVTPKRSHMFKFVYKYG